MRKQHFDFRQNTNTNTTSHYRPVTLYVVACRTEHMGGKVLDVYIKQSVGLRLHLAGNGTDCITDLQMKVNSSCEIWVLCTSVFLSATIALQFWHPEEPINSKGALT